jgi:hypothetical protein
MNNTSESTMGADLYIPKIRNPEKAVWGPKFDEACALREAAQDDIARAAAQKLVDDAYEHLWGGDGYFRDAYNSTSVLWRLGLSWWNDVEYDAQSEGSDINVSPAACRRLLDKIEAATFTLPTREELVSGHAKVDDDENSVESWHKYYTEKRGRLVAFLKRAIENGGMYASC